MRAAAGLLASWACAALATATESPTTEHVVTLAGLFPPNQVAALAKTLPADRKVTFRVRAPSGAAASGVLVYISPTDSGELPESWTRVLDEKQLLWIAAEESEIHRWLAQGRDARAEIAERFAHIPNGKLEYVAGAGHMLHHDQPERVARLIEAFLDAGAR